MAGRLKSWALAPLFALFLTGADTAPVSIAVKDLTPRFLTFYRAATAAHADPDARFKLWKQDYAFAAVPPTPEGDNIARKLLDAAWPKYPAVMARIERGAAGMEPNPRIVLARVAALLHPSAPVEITMIAYVGALEGNAFTVGDKGHATVAIPVEETPRERGPAMAHEFTHAVQISMGTNAGGWERSIGETVLAEGLAMRVAHLSRSAGGKLRGGGERTWLAGAGRSPARRDPERYSSICDIIEIRRCHAFHHGHRSFRRRSRGLLRRLADC